jgi:hypothetical protein
MVVFIQKGDKPLSPIDAIERGNALRLSEMSKAGIRKADETILSSVPHEELAQSYPRLLEALQRLPATAEGEITFSDYIDQCESDNIINAQNNHFNALLFAYREAQERLSKYRLADGREEIVESIETGELDPETGEAITETVVVAAAIEPLPAQIERPVFDEETGEQIGIDLVPNPEIVADDEERTEAQAIIDATPQSVKDHAEV